MDVDNFGRVVVADTVGFVRQLPHTLIDAFRATLEEVASSNLLIHVVDCADDDKLDRIQDAKAVLSQAKSKGAKGEGFDKLGERLNTSSVEVKNEIQEDSPIPPSILDELKLDQAIRLAKKKIKDGFSEEAKKIYQDILKKFPKNKPWKFIKTIHINLKSLILCRLMKS